MGSDSGASDDDARDDALSFPNCPYCGNPVLFSVATGPHTGSLAPCGCSMPPGLFPSLRDD